MSRVPPPPIVASSLSGFVVGVVLTLVATGTIGRSTAALQLTPTIPPATIPPPTTTVAEAQMQKEIKRIAGRQLGLEPSSAKTPRLLDVKLRPAIVHLLDPESASPFGHYRSVDLEFTLNDHPLGRAWRLKAAKSDVFSVMKALYTSGLPIYNVEMVGKFPLRSGKVLKPRTAVIAYLEFYRASKIPWHRWDRGKESQVWSMLTYHWVDPRFA
jgi:hypothetical protein